MVWKEHFRKIERSDFMAIFDVFIDIKDGIINFMSIAIDYLPNFLPGVLLT